ncbi:phosphate ABC transporter substrate-binding protein [uncultured Desulfuromusa sp.]|uniref:PstS family phosphate ABC transporter substrate-binding protein n=1 Tax=uncultured Desulfuromusa sp. TaxID=219183 RepID=UPI002AA8D995|nr:phosphate ABC transporter substrate-binding protein [uncultured Desulfuromusa sp.]
MKQQKSKILALALLALVLFASAGIASPLKVDVNISDYVKVQGVAGNLNSVGSDTLNNMMTFWAEGFRKKYPNVNIQIEGKGSSTAPPALIEGTSQIGPMSRKMKSKEVQAFEGKYGFKPTTIGVALDSLAVFINKDNPINGLSIPQVDAIFSKTLKGGLPNAAVWGDVGLTGEWANKPISLYGRNSASGTYGYFKGKALFKGDYKDSVKEQPGSASVVLGVTEDTAGIGYSGIGYKTSGVKAISLSKETGGTQYEPNYANVMNGKYPLGRMLYVNVVKEPNKPLPTLVKEFLKFVLSKEGQEIVIKDGYLPLTAEIVKQQLALLD